MEGAIDDFGNDQLTPNYRNYAGFWLRFLAAIIDYIILNIASSFITSPILKLMGIYVVEKVDVQQQEEFGRIFRENPGVSIIEVMRNVLGISANQLMIVFCISAIVNWLYYALMESSPKRATLGKMALGLQVCDLNGDQVSFLRATGRHFAKYLSAFTLFIGYIMAGLTEKKQALHDVVAGCLVYRK